MCALVVACHAGGAGLFARAKTASGGVHWDAVHSYRADGAVTTGGLHGTVRTTVDVRTGRSTTSFELGPVTGAEGYDGTRSWERDPGGEVASADAPEAMRRARSQAWLDARAYWYPQRVAATYGATTSNQVDGKPYDVVVATPDGGDPVTLWFATDTHLLARVEQRQGADTVTTAFDDYRPIGGVSVPFHTITDTTDAAGRTDPREHGDIRFERVALNVAVADADFAIPKMTVSARVDDPSGVTTIPFDLVNNHIYVDARIGDAPVRVLVDTGGNNVLVPAAARRLGIVGEGKLAAGGVGDHKVDVAVAHAPDVRVGNAVLAKPVFLIVDLGALHDVEGVDVDGVIGYEMFRRFGIEIDYANRRLVIAEAAKLVPPAGAVAIPFELDEHIPIIAGTLDGLPMRISIDTGSRGSLTLHAPFVAAHDLTARYHAAPEAVTGWGIGGAARGRPVRFGTLQLGSVRIDGVAGDLYTGRKGAFANPDLGANLGGRVLRRFDVVFDYAKKILYLAPNPAWLGKPDDFDRSGLWLLRDGDALSIVDVAPDTAASAADMRAGDRVLAIGGELVARRSLSDWRERLASLPVASHVAIRFVRDGKEQTSELVLADRIPATVVR